MLTSGQFALDVDLIMLNCYRLMCLFFADIEISRVSNPDKPETIPYYLELKYFDREMSRILLETALHLRVFDDQMESALKCGNTVDHYFGRRDKVNSKFHCLLFDPQINLRDTCNKIIHAKTITPQKQYRDGGHDIDYWNDMSYICALDDLPDAAVEKPETTKWSHLSGHVRIAGVKNRIDWAHILDVREFIKATYALLQRDGSE